LGDDSFFTSDMVCSDEDDDDSLQDTACSSAAGPKVWKKGILCLVLFFFLRIMCLVLACFINSITNIAFL
jgi:hypothetical protein